MILNNRLHNISLNLHTVSGVILCVILFVIFYCGAFALFKNDIAAWEERVDLQKELPSGTNLLDDVYHNLQNKGNYQNREILIFQFEDKSNFKLFVAGDSTYKREFFHFTDRLKERPNYTSLNDLLYHIHYLRPIPIAGIYIAGIVCLLFVFSIITGVLVQLKKFFKDFFLLRKRKKRLTFLKDSHVALGVITLPFQLMFAVTGGVFCLLLILIIPQVLVQFNGDTSKMEKYFEDVPATVESLNKPLHFNELSSFVNEFEMENEVSLNYLRIYHFGDENMQLLMAGRKDEVDSEIKSLYQASTGVLVEHYSNEEAALFEHVNNWLSDLHYANFGGVAVKFIYFILALISCVVFYSGGLLWIETRKKKLKRIDFYFEGIIWGLIVAVIFSFLMRYWVASVTTLFYGVWILWAVLVFVIGGNKYVRISKLVALALTLIFLTHYFLAEDFNSIHKLTIPFMCIAAMVVFILYQQTALFNIKKTQTTRTNKE